MKKFLLLLLVAIFFLPIKAQTADAVMSKVQQDFSRAKNIKADFVMSSSQMNAKGSILMSGKKFCVLTNDFKSWYDGKTQWIYSTATGEVNILEPSLETLELNNPYLAVMDYSANYNATLKSNGGNNYVVNLIAKNKSADIKNIQLKINKKNNRIIEVKALMTDDDVQIIQFSNYRINENISSSAFVFDDKMIPKGTPIIDLR